MNIFYLFNYVFVAFKVTSNDNFLFKSNAVCDVKRKIAELMCTFEVKTIFFMNYKENILK